jgi:kynurenine formamidase
MTTYPGLPGPIVCDYLSREESRARYAPGTEFQIGKIELVSNTGTYVDTPFHRYPDGDDLARQPLGPLAGRPRAGRPPRTGGRGDRARGVRQRVRVTTAVEMEQCRWPCRRGLVGIDCLNIDSAAGGERPEHTALLGARIPLVEHMTGLAAVPDGARFYAVPPPIEGMGTFPVRAFAVAG